MNKIYGFGIITLLLAVTFVAGLNTPHFMPMNHKQAYFTSLKEDIQDHNRQHGQYRCCLKTPCTYCIEKTPGHGEGSTCDCLKDIVEGRHPCGECIGEILEGHGSPYLKEYFAKAIAEEVGEEHLPTLNKIIEQKYSTDETEDEE